jgi:hypothetical protein
MYVGLEKSVERRMDSFSLGMASSNKVFNIETF